MPAKKITPIQKPSTEVVTVIPTTAELPSLIQHMDPDRILVILRAAEAGNTRDLFALYRDVVAADNHIQAELGKRKLAVLGDVFRVLPFDSKNAADKSAADECKRAVSKIKGWRTACSHLLDSTLWPVALVEKVFRADGPRFAIDKLVPVPGYLLDYASGYMRISDVDPATGTILATTHEPDPARYIVHRSHLLSMPDTWGGPMRSILFWWLLSNMSRGWWARFLDRYGSPFPVGKYPKGDTASRTVLADAFALSVRLGGLVVSDETSVELIQSAVGSSGDAYEKFIGVCQREKSKLILGQTLSSQADATGLGSGTADLQSDVRDDIRQFDAAMLSETLRDQLLTQIVELGGIAGSVPTPVWGAKGPRELKAMAELLTALRGADLDVDDDALDTLSSDAGFNIRRRLASPLLRNEQAIPGDQPSAPAAAENIQTLALNGAQVESLLSVLDNVSTGKIPKSSALHIIRASFPTISEATIAGMLADIAIVPPSVEPTPHSAGAIPAHALHRLRELPADVARAIRESSTPDDCRRRILTLCSAGNPAHVTALIADAAAIHAAIHPPR